MDVRLMGASPAFANILFWSYISEAKTGMYRPCVDVMSDKA